MKGEEGVGECIGKATVRLGGGGGGVVFFCGNELFMIQGWVEM